MKFIALLLLAAPSFATPYARLFDPHHIQQSAGFDAPVLGGTTQATTSIALVTHATADGSIMPKSCQDTFCPPEDWVIWQIGGGGSFTGTALITTGTSFNAAPYLLGWAVKGISVSSPAVLQALKGAILGTSPSGRLRIGYDFGGNVVREGHVESLKEMLPGRGLADVVGRNSYVNFGWAWAY